MKRIKMRQSESMLTKGGVVRFDAGKEYEVDDWIAASLAGRMLAEIVESVPEQQQKKGKSGRRKNDDSNAEIVSAGRPEAPQKTVRLYDDRTPDPNEQWLAETDEKRADDL